MEEMSEQLSDVLLKARAEYAEKQRKNPTSVVNFRNSLQDERLRRAFDEMFNKDGSFTDRGKKDFERFSRIKLTMDGSLTYYVVHSNPNELYKFLCYYILKERKYRLIKEQNKLHRMGKPEALASQRVFALMPIITFASTFVDRETKGKLFEESWGDNPGKIFAIYLPNVQLFGNQMPFYATSIKEYACIKNRINEHIIILAEADFPEFTAGGMLPVINLHTGKVSTAESEPTQQISNSFYNTDTTIGTTRAKNGEINL